VLTLLRWCRAPCLCLGCFQEAAGVPHRGSAAYSHGRPPGSLGDPFRGRRTGRGRGRERGRGRTRSWERRRGVQPGGHRVSAVRRPGVRTQAMWWCWGQPTGAWSFPTREGRTVTGSIVLPCARTALNIQQRMSAECAHTALSFSRHNFFLIAASTLLPLSLSPTTPLSFSLLSYPFLPQAQPRGRQPCAGPGASTARSLSPCPAPRQRRAILEVRPLCAPG